MKKLIVLFLFLFLPFIASNAQVEFSAEQVGKQYNPKFYIDFVDYKLPKSVTKKSFDYGKTKVGVLIQMPYSSVKFKKSSKGYNAEYSVSLTFFDKKKENVIVEKLWNEKIFTRNYKQTYSTNNFNISFKSINLKPQIYTVVCSVEGQNSKTPIAFQAKIKVRKFANPDTSKKPVQISDVIFVKKRIKLKGKETIVPNVSNILSPNDKTIELYYEIYSNKNRMVEIEKVAKDLSRNKFFKQSKIVKLKRGTNSTNSVIKMAKLALGDYNVEIRIKNKDDKLLAAIKNNFTVAIPNLPASLKNLDKAVEEMKYIADEDTIDSIENAPDFDTKLKMFLAFWRHRDPDAATRENQVMNEYYRRVEYANNNFKSYTDGWNTDRGMIYITLGPPDQVEREPVAMDRKPYEIWYYYNRDLKFIFQEETYFNDYRLLNPQYGEWDRYR